MALSWANPDNLECAPDYQNLLDGALVTHKGSKQTDVWRLNTSEPNSDLRMLELIQVDVNFSSRLYTSIENLRYYIDTDNETIKQIAEFNNTTAYYLIKNNADQKEIDEILQLYIDADIEKKALKPAEAKLKEKEKQIKSHSIS